MSTKGPSGSFQRFQMSPAAKKKKGVTLLRKHIKDTQSKVLFISIFYLRKKKDGDIFFFF